MKSRSLPVQSFYILVMSNKLEYWSSWSRRGGGVKAFSSSVIQYNPVVGLFLVENYNFTEAQTQPEVNIEFPRHFGVKNNLPMSGC